MNKTKIFFDFEATSVARDADMISVGLVAVRDVEFVNMLSERPSTTIKTFYGEFVDYTIDKCDEWVKENVIKKLHLPYPSSYPTDFDNQTVKGNQNEIKTFLIKWLSQFEDIEFWCDIHTHVN